MTIFNTIRNDVELLTKCTQLFGATVFDRATFDEARRSCNRHGIGEYLPGLETLVNHRIVIKVGETESVHEVTYPDCSVHDCFGKVIERNVDYVKSMTSVKYLYAVNHHYGDELRKLIESV